MNKIYNYFRHTIQGKIIIYFFITILLSNIATFFIISPIINRKFSSFQIDLKPILTEMHGIKFLVLGISFTICLTSLCLLSSLAVRQIKKLTKATNEVAEGNFDVRLETKEKDELAQLKLHFNDMARKLKNTAYIQKDFVNNVSHEIKTPIASIQGFAKILKNNKLSEEEKREYLDIIIEESKRLENLSKNILKISKLENQDVIDNEIKFSLDESIRKAILILQNKWIDKDISFNLDLQTTFYYGN